MGQEIKNKTALVFGASRINDIRFINDYLDSSDNFVICADGGVSNAARAGLITNIVIGDCDSGGNPIDGAKFILLNTEKDLTDMQAAVQTALESGVREILMFGCTGERADHFLANVSLLEYISESGIPSKIIDEDNEIIFFKGGVIKIQNEPRFKYLSIIPVDDLLEGVTLKGLKYPLNNAVIKRGDTIGVSNEPEEENPTIEIKKGKSLIIRSNRI